MTDPERLRRYYTANFGGYHTATKVGRLVYHTDVYCNDGERIKRENILPGRDEPIRRLCQTCRGQTWGRGLSTRLII